MEDKEIKKGKKKEFLGYDLSSNKGKNHLNALTLPNWPQA